MDSFVYISITALCCYTFLMLAFLAAKKNKAIKSFLMVLATLILWTGGSFCMRMQLCPSVQLWFNLSIAGLTLLPYALLHFVDAFMGLENKFYEGLWLSILLLLNVVNWNTGVFIACPTVKQIDGGHFSFAYSYSWLVVVLFVVLGVLVCSIFRTIYQCGRSTDASRNQLRPIVFGIIVLFLGHMGLLLPAFKEFPVDILSGVLNAFFLFYALYKQRLFKMTLLVSRRNCYAAAIVLSVLLFFYWINPLRAFLNAILPSYRYYHEIIIVGMFDIAMLAIYHIMKQFIDHIFIKDSIIQANNLKQFSAAVSRSLNIDEILEEIGDIIQKTIAVNHVFICIRGEGPFYQIAHSTSPLGSRDFSFQTDSPIVNWLSEHGECILMQDFKRTVAYKAMWESEKRQLNDLNIQCFVPLKDETELVGIVMLSDKKKRHEYTYEDISFLSSLNSIGCIALKNSKLYEKACLEACTDELTGLLNRKYFYEVIQREYEKSQEHALALIILNLDDFKLYNQLYGNRAGDAALQKVAQIIKASVGSSGYVARYGGKEFAIILPMFDLYAAKNLAETIRQQILNMNKSTTDYVLKVLTVSGGICSIPYAANNVEQLIEHADMAVYHAKRKGKNMILVYSVHDNALEHQPTEDSDSKVDIYLEYAPTIYALTAAINAKDNYTFNHSNNVMYYSTKLAVALGMNEEFVEIVREAALLHDIGKIGIPEHILNKPGKLTDDEYNIIKTHVENSIGIIRHLPSINYVIPAVIGHHERYDGMGYPRKLSGEDIPFAARILCVADSFDAMVSKRPYKEPFSVNKALDILENQAGKQFDPKLIGVFIPLVRQGVIRTDRIEA